MASARACPFPVAGLAIEVQRLLEVAAGLLVAALPQVNTAEVGQGRRLGRAVADLPGRAAGMTVHGGRLPEVAAYIEITEQRGGQPDGMAGPAVPGGMHDDRDQVRPFSI
ncbi:MAG TPA: hypothetical protein VIJ82_05390 [Streptosporangiaceae bacterium]